MKKPLKTHYHLTSHLSGVLKTVSENLYFEIHHKIDEYSAQYTKAVNLHDGLSAAHGFNLIVQDFVDKLLADNSGPPVSCKKGCAACCSLHIDITDHEAQLLVLHSKDENIVIDWDKLTRQSLVDLDSWFTLTATERQCVFLDTSTNQCKVYEYRPASCRKAMVVSDAELCNTITHPKQQVKWAVSNYAEIIASAVLNATKSGSMATMLIEQRNYEQN